MKISEHIRIAYFIPNFRISHDQVLCSQVLGQANALHEDGFECMLISSELNDISVKKALATHTLKGFSEICILPIYPHSPNSFRFYKIANIAAKMSASIVIKWKPDIIYVRGSDAFRPALKLARMVSAKVVYDARGLIAEESLMKRGRWNILAYYHRYRELEACRKADILFCVSNRFRLLLETRIGRKDIFVVPSCVNPQQFQYSFEARLRIRQQLGWSNETPVVAYCGGLSIWQRIDDVLRLMVEMKSLEPALKCLLLTSSPSVIRKMAIQAGLVASDFHCEQVPNETIQDWLSVVDAGIILRHDLPVNNVASPVKIAEYLACGLPVICSSEIGDLSDLIEQSHAGIVLIEGHSDHATKAVELIKRVNIDHSYRHNARQLVLEKLSWSSNINTYRMGYTRDKN